MVISGPIPGTAPLNILILHGYIIIITIRKLKLVTPSMGLSQ